MKHTDFLEMANNATEGRRGATGVRVSFGPPPPGGIPQRIMLRLNGPVPTGQPIPVRIVHRAGSGQNGAAWSPGVAFSSDDPTVVQLQQQQRETIEQEEELRKIRTKKEAEKKKKVNEERDEKLRKKLGYDKPPEVQQSGEGVREGVELSWSKLEVEVPGDVDGELSYTVQAYLDDKTEGREVYSGSATSCPVPAEILTLGHTHHFKVAACLGTIKGDFSPSCSIKIPAERPSKPLPPKVSNRGKNNLTLRWNAPSDNGSAITHYELEWDQCKGQWEKLVSEKTKQYKFVHKFQPASHAQFRVRATNEMGTSEYSDVLSFSSGAGPPSVPKPPSMVEVGIELLTLAWEPPESNGADITSYTLEMENPESGYGYRPVYQGDQTSYTCSGLRRVTCYNFRLAASNEKGQSQMSPSVTFKTLPSIPGPPALPYLKDRPQAHSLNIAWQEPPDNGGSEIQTYVLQMSGGLSSKGATSELVDVYTGPFKAFLAETLLPGRKYETRVCGVSSAGHGQWSPVATFSTPAVVPSPPLSLTLTGRPGQYALSLQWMSPQSDGGAAITSHAVEVKSSAGEWNVVGIEADPSSFECSSSASLQAMPLSYTVANLLPGTQYAFRVRCRNSVGIGAPSVECVGATAPGQPDSPEGLEVASVTANSATLRWERSQCHGCPVESYELQCVEEGSSVGSHTASITCSATLQKLQPATSYQIRVKACSSVGDSEWSCPVSFATASAPPAPPSHLDLIKRGPSSLLVSWNAPVDHGSPVTAYHLEVGTEAGHSSSRMESVDPQETQFNIMDLKPSTTYRFRVQAQNGIGWGAFGAYKSGSTLLPPPSPPHLSLASCSPNMLKVVWGKKTSRHLTFVLQLASPGSQFHEVYQGVGVSHRITRLQPDTNYALRIAAISDSGKGEWSDSITFSTTPIHPEAVTGISLKHGESQTLKLEWDESSYSMPLTYEAQYRNVSSNQEFQQCYKGAQQNTNIFISPPSPSSNSNSGRGTTLVYEARVRSCAVCQVNGRKEQLWSPYSNTAICRWEEEPPKAESTDNNEDTVVEGKKKSRSFCSGMTLTMLVLILVTVVTVIVAIALGQVINV